MTTEITAPLAPPATPVKRVQAKPPNAGKGRVKGVPNRATANAREAIGAFVDSNSGRLQALLDEIERTEGPHAAWNCIMDVVEYHVPKLARTELTGKDGAAITLQVAPTDQAL